MAISRLRYAIELLTELEKKLGWIKGTFSYQIFQNTETLEKKNPDLLGMIEALVKTPFRRTLGKIDGMLASLRECITILEKIHNEGG